jgi:hypothetical protein
MTPEAEEGEVIYGFDVLCQLTVKTPTRWFPESQWPFSPV